MSVKSLMEKNAVCIRKNNWIFVEVFKKVLFFSDIVQNLVHLDSVIPSVAVYMHISLSSIAKFNSPSGAMEST